MTARNMDKALLRFSGSYFKQQTVLSNRSQLNSRIRKKFVPFSYLFNVPTETELKALSPFFFLVLLPYYAMIFMGTKLGHLEGFYVVA